ncbi:skin secretory protein xP2-like [Vulpes lagopus]|uniref:skin secretory protein xP2-like n=1 Tax=Vulpes lagopus TaxID=494514 RepID=UPI001BCA5A30|nr:skin secretory protein xP2-like [Vulpes lagopus]
MASGMVILCQKMWGFCCTGVGDCKLLFGVSIISNLGERTNHLQKLPSSDGILMMLGVTGKYEAGAPIVSGDGGLEPRRARCGGERRKEPNCGGAVGESREAEGTKLHGKSRSYTERAEGERRDPRAAKGGVVGGAKREVARRGGRAEPSAQGPGPRGPGGGESRGWRGGGGEPRHRALREEPPAPNPRAGEGVVDPPCRCPSLPAPTRRPPAPHPLDRWESGADARSRDRRPRGAASEPRCARDPNPGEGRRGDLDAPRPPPACGSAKSPRIPDGGWRARCGPGAATSAALSRGPPPGPPLPLRAPAEVLHCAPVSLLTWVLLLDHGPVMGAPNLGSCIRHLSFALGHRL